MEDNILNNMHAGAKPEVFRFAAMLRSHMTESEKKLWEFLKSKPLEFKFRRQHPFSLYVLDFYSHKAKLAIEIDGDYHNVNKQEELDEKRTEHIMQFGISELRFNDEDVISSFDFVKNEILSFLSYK